MAEGTDGHSICSASETEARKGPSHGVVAGRRRARRGRQCSEDDLLQMHYPRYFYDANENYFPVDLNRYTIDQSAVDGINGTSISSKDGEHTWLIYMSYYLRDGGIPALGGRGGHKHDLEIVIVEIGDENRNVTGVFYAPHSGHEHMWIRHKDDLKQILEDGRPCVYVSNGKHACYPVPGAVMRLFGLGTDACRNPQARDRPLFPLDERTKRVDRIDGEFPGPKKRITRNWSVAPETRLRDIGRRRAFPPRGQVVAELRKIQFWKK